MNSDNDATPVDGAGFDLEESLSDAIYSFDAHQLRRLMSRYCVDPDMLVDGLPMIHLSLDAETDRGIGDMAYTPTGSCIVVLLDAGADPHSIHLGKTIVEYTADQSGFRVLGPRVEAAIERSERRHQDRNRNDI